MTVITTTAQPGPAADCLQPSAYGNTLRAAVEAVEKPRSSGDTLLDSEEGEGGNK